MRIGVFGGSFDPPHVGHFLAAVDAADRLELDSVIWVPAARQPLKTDTPHAATPEQRHAMVMVAASADPRFSASRTEIDRPGLSYTVATVEEFAHEYPDAERFLLLGEDAWSRFDEWRDPSRIRALARVEVLARRNGSDHSGRVIEVSSSEIRARVRAGRTVRGFVQDAVAEIIESEGLYQW